MKTMKKVEVVEGVVAEYKGAFWGRQYDNQTMTITDFGEFDKATISKSEYCTKPTDFTYNSPSNPAFEKLSKAKLIRVKKITTTEFEILDEKEVK